MAIYVNQWATANKYLDVLPNKVSLSILLHWMAKERSELSKIVMRSSSTKMEKREHVTTWHYMIRLVIGNYCIKPMRTFL